MKLIALVLLLSLPAVAQTISAPPPSLGGSLNLSRMERLNSLLRDRDTTTNPITLVSFGDSVSEYGRGPQRVLFRTLASWYGLQEAMRDDDNVKFAWNWPAFAGGAAVAVGPDDYWLTDYYRIPAKGSVVFTNYFDGKNGFVSARGFEVYYLASPQSGSFGFEVDSGADYSTLATINAHAALAALRSTNILLRSNGLVPTRVRFVGLSGTSSVMCCLPLISTSPARDKIKTVWTGKGGEGLDRMLGVKSNLLWSIFSTIRPNLFAFHMKHENTLTVSNLAYLTEIVTNASPGCEMLFFGTPPAISDLLWRSGNELISRFCSSNGWIYVDLASQVPDQSTDFMTAQHWWCLNAQGVPDGLHPTLAAYEVMLRPFLESWGIGAPGNAEGPKALITPAAVEPAAPSQIPDMSGLSTNLQVVIPGSKTITLMFRKGILIGIQ